MMDKLQTIPECHLGFVELNASQPTTIMFLHGALSCPVEASLVTPHLQNYHILIPALNTNVKAPAPNPNRPFSLTGICSQVAILIQNRAKNGHAHIYGHSMGAHIAVNLAILHPDRVMTIIASGITLFSHWSWMTRSLVTPIIHTQAAIPRTFPRKQKIQLFKFGMRPASDAIAEEFMSFPVECDWTACKEVGTSLIESLPADKPVNVKARALIVVGGTTPADPVNDLKWVVNEIRKAGGKADGVEIKQGSHPWLLQLPELCANLIVAWIEERELPEGSSKIL